MTITSTKTAILSCLALAALATVPGRAEARGFGHGSFGHHGGFHHGFHHRFGGHGWWSPAGGYAAGGFFGDCHLVFSPVWGRYERVCR
ncbi:hypothetical protein ACQKQD_05600 [Methylobacterium sp. NPDC080182]|uniref:hypothetical protein n=1 Tax=Methylobacterium sp. NPDC080182 TaxID=3390590 RepID=UPI003D0843DF